VSNGQQTGRAANTPLPLRALVRIYVALFGRRAFYRWNLGLARLALYGMGFGSPTGSRISVAEERLLKNLVASDAPCVLDVGAYVGEYAARVRRFCPGAKIWAFEPNPATFTQLQKAARRDGFTAVNVGLSDRSGLTQLYDYASLAGNSGSVHATLYPGVIDGIYHREPADVRVEVTTIDAFMESERVTHLRLVKIDAEGHELAILRGAKRAIASGKVDVVQFEFNEMNVISRVFFRDFYEVLPGFTFYRMVTDGLVHIGRYRPRTHEIFSLQNIVAIRDGVNFGPGLI